MAHDAVVSGLATHERAAPAHIPVRLLSNKCNCTNLCNWHMLVGIGPVSRFPYKGTFSDVSRTIVSFNDTFAHDKDLAKLT